MDGYWYCPQCQEALPSSRFTNHELCDTCGASAEWIDGHESYEELRERAEKAELQNKVLENALEDMAMVAYGSEYKSRVQFHVEVTKHKLGLESEFADLDNVPESEG